MPITQRLSLVHSFNKRFLRAYNVQVLISRHWGHSHEQNRQKPLLWWVGGFVGGRLILEELVKPTEIPKVGYEVVG